MKHNKHTSPSKYIFTFIGVLIFGFSIISLIFPNLTAYSAPVMDNTAGIYTDDFTNNTKVPTRSYVNVNTATEVLQLTSSASQTTFTTPYRTEGYAVTSVIKPLIIAQWDTLTINSTIPENTTLKVQILTDYSSFVWGNEYMPGNEEGIDVSTNPTIDLSTIPVMGCAFDPEYGAEWGCDKTSSIRIKFLMTTTDDTITPTVNDISVSWTVRQGDLTPTTLSQDPWPTTRGNQQKTSYTKYYNETIYPAFKWLSNTHSQDPFYSQLFVLNDRLVGFVSNSFSRLFALNRNTGQELWKIQAQYFNNGPGIIGSDGTIYAHEMLGDAVKAVDTNSGQIKWLYNWMGGHGTGIILGENGKLYYIRDSAESPNITLYEQNPDGTIESQTVFDVVPEGLSSERKDTTLVAKGYNNLAYFRTSINQTTYPYGLSDKGRLFAVNLETKEIVWSYQETFYDVIVDTDGTVYGASSVGLNLEKDSMVKKMYAFNPDGTIKWESSRGADDSRGYTSQLILTKDNRIISVRFVSASDWSRRLVEFTNTEDGSVEKSYYPEDTLSYLHFVDGINGYYSSSAETIDSETSHRNLKVNYSDATGNLKWQIIYPYYNNEEGKDVWRYLNTIVPDERGWLYGTFARDSNDLEWNRIPEDSFTKTYALAPWNLSIKTDKAGYKAGDTVTFTATTSMLESNPVFGGDNMMQIVMNNGTKIPLTYSSTNSSGNTLWTGSYNLPSDSAEGNISYTVEAAQTYLKTDTTTHFDTPPTQTGNSGIVLGSNINVVVPTIRITDIGLISNVLDRNSLKYFFTSTKPVIKGTTQANSTVTFEYEDEIFTSKANSSGDFTITLTIDRGSNELEYYSTDTSGNRSITKSLNLIVGSENFPLWLLERLGIVLNSEEDIDDTQEEDTVDETDNIEETEQQDDEQQEDTYTPPVVNRRKIKFTDKRGGVLAQATVEIEGNTYITDDNGEIELENLENRTYAAKVKTKDGKIYSMDILGVGDESGNIVVEVEEDSDVDWFKILIYTGIALLVLIVGGVLIGTKKN